MLDVFGGESKPDHVFVVMKSGQLVIWKFDKPIYSWKHIVTLDLCKTRGPQLVSMAYDKKNWTLLWCEKRSASSCCICSATLIFNEDDTIVLSSIKPVLHNCLPMTVLMVRESTFCLKSTSNKPPGLMLFWSYDDDTMRVG